jgi:hypothetical protein
MMSMGKSKRGIIKNVVLISVMAFYFSCGKDVFPPDSPGEPSSERGAPTTWLALHDAEKRFSSRAVEHVSCTSENRRKIERVPDIVL